jgi:hypothetical protein
LKIGSGEKASATRLLCCSFSLKVSERNRLCDPAHAITKTAGCSDCCRITQTFVRELLLKRRIGN